jgi:hypothetical protein
LKLAPSKPEAVVEEYADILLQGMKHIHMKCTKQASQHKNTKHYEGKLFYTMLINSNRDTLINYSTEKLN